MFQLNRNFGRALQLNTKQIVRWSSTEGYAAQRVKYQAQLTEMRKVWQAEFIKRQEEKEQRLKEEQRIMVQNKAVRIREERLASLIRQEADRKRKAESAQRLRQTRARKHLVWDKEQLKQSERYGKVAADLREEAKTWVTYDNMNKMITGDLFARDSATTGFVSRYSKHWRYQVESGDYSFEKMMKPSNFVEPSYDRYERMERRRGTVRFKERQELSDYLSTMVSTGEERAKFQDLVTEFMNFDKDTRTDLLGVEHKDHAFEAKWAARDKEEMLHELGMSKYTYNTRHQEEYDALHAQQYEDAGSDLEESEVFDRRPGLNFGMKKNKSTEGLFNAHSDDDEDLLDRLSESESDGETGIDYSVQYGIKDGPEAAEAYRAIQLKSGADPATLDSVIATIDAVREVLSGKQGLTAAQTDEKLDALGEKLDRLQDMLNRRRVESRSVYCAIYAVQMAQYRTALLEGGVSASTVESTISTLQEVEDFYMTDVNYGEAGIEDKLAALHATLTGLLEEIESKEADTEWVDGAIDAVESAQFRAAQVKRGADADATEAVISAVNRTHNILDGVHDYSDAEKESKLVRLHNKLSALRDASEETLVDPSPIDKALADIQAYFEESGDASDGDANCDGSDDDNADLLSRVATAREELQNAPAKNTTMQAELARLESLATYLTGGSAADMDAESARLHAKLVNLRDTAVAQRAQLANNGADVSVIDAEIEHLDDRIAKAHSGSLNTVHSDSDSDLEGHSDEDQSARAQMLQRLEAKLARLNAKRVVIQEQNQEYYDSEEGEKVEEEVVEGKK